MCTNWHLVGSLSRRLCKVFAFFFLSSPLESRRGEFESEFRGITVAHTLAQLYLPLLCQLALQHYLSALEWLVGRPVGRSAGRPNGSDVVPPGALRGAVCAVNVNAGAHGIARSEAASSARPGTTIGL